MPNSEGHPIVGVDPYPIAPGHQDETTSIMAAVKVAPTVVELRAMILEVLHTKHMTCEELSDHFGIQFLSIRPRCTELKKMGLIVKSGAQRMQRTGGYANAWMPSTPAPPPVSNQPPLPFTQPAQTVAPAALQPFVPPTS